MCHSLQLYTIVLVTHFTLTGLNKGTYERNSLGWYKSQSFSHIGSGSRDIRMVQVSMAIWKTQTIPMMFKCTCNNIHKTDICKETACIDLWH